MGVAPEHARVMSTTDETTASRKVAVIAISLSTTIQITTPNLDFNANANTSDNTKNAIIQ